MLRPKIARQRGLDRPSSASSPHTHNGSRPNGNGVTFDVDNELLQRANPLPVPLSVGEYGATTGLPRILDALDRHQVTHSEQADRGV